jgi:putative SbcD/Mre11-related phosphoesterase
MNPIPIWNEKALHLKEKKLIIIADLHIGIEFEYQQKGYNIGVQTDRILDAIKSIVYKTKAETLIILGDIRHTITALKSKQKGLMIKEHREIRHLLEELSNIVSIHIIKGNHDGALQSKYATLHSARGAIFHNVSMLHGHCWPNKELLEAPLMLLAHVHPFIKIKAKVGLLTLQPCWIRGKIKKDKLISKYENAKKDINFIIMPAFNPLCRGLVLNTENQLQGALFSLIDFKYCTSYSLEGINFGRLHNLK